MSLTEAWQKLNYFFKNLIFETLQVQYTSIHLVTEKQKKTYPPFLFKDLFRFFVTQSSKSFSPTTCLTLKTNVFKNHRNNVFCREFVYNQIFLHMTNVLPNIRVIKFVRSNNWICFTKHYISLSKWQTLVKVLLVFFISTVKLLLFIYDSPMVRKPFASVLF